MRKLIMALNISLDGFADHTVATADDELHEFFSNLLDETGIELFGRITYQMMESYWPDAHKDPEISQTTLEFAQKFNAIPKIVFSNTLQKAEWTNTTLVNSDAIDYVKKLKTTDGMNIFIGGIALAESLASHGLVDEYWLVVHPVIAGRGRKFLEHVNQNFQLKLLSTKTFKSGAVALHYAASDLRLSTLA